MKKTINFSLVIISLLFANDCLGNDQCQTLYNSKDYPAAFKKCLPKAKQGDAEAQTTMGYLYDTGHGVVQDAKEAAKWYRLAAEQGGLKAQINLGWDYEHGLGVCAGCE